MVYRRRRTARRPARRPRRRGLARKLQSGALTTINKSLQPIANRYICKMKYATTVLTSASGQYQFRLNSLFDPDLTGLGHQPYGFDNLALLYNRYRVIATGWRIQQPSSFNGTPVVFGALPNNDVSVTWDNFGEMAENPRAKTVLNNPGGSIRVLRGKVSLPKLMGRTRAQYMADDNFQAIVNTNPAENAILYLASFNALTGEAIPNIPIHVILEYTVEFFDLKHIVQS